MKGAFDMKSKEIASPPLYDVTVIGAGLAGTLTALKLANKGYKVLLIDKEGEIIPRTSSSFNESYRLHTGFHYVGDLDTAKQCLLNAIEFAKEFPDCILGGEDVNNPLRRSRYYFMSKSLFPLSEIKNVAKELKTFYAELIAKDSKNKVFGKPEDFFQTLDPKHYEHVSNDIPFYNLKYKESIKVQWGIETAESLIDIEKLKNKLTKKIKENKNIHFVPYTEATQISQKADSIGYVVTTKDKKTFHTKGIVNCAWQNAEKLNKTVGNYTPDPNRVNRLKASIRVKLPKGFENLQTCLFGVGPFCSFANLGDGTGILTSEKTTNIDSYQAGERFRNKEVNELIQTLDPKQGKGQELAEKILAECASYIPLLQDCTIQEIRLGYVKLMETKQTYTTSSLYTKESPIHSRIPDGITINDLLYISGDAMKMINAPHNAIKIANILDKHFETAAVMEGIFALAKKQVNENLPKTTPTLLNPLLYITNKRILWEEAKKIKETAELKKNQKFYANWTAAEVIKYINNMEKVKHEKTFDPAFLKKSNHTFFFEGKRGSQKEEIKKSSLSTSNALTKDSSRSKL